MASGNNLHSGHRSRMKEKYSRLGSEVFSDHELLEMLLFHSIPRSDTNETAHLLIERFGSLDKVFSADLDMLRSVKGVGESSAILISLIGDINARISRQPFEKIRKFRTLSDVGKLLTSRYSGARKEYFSALYFTSTMELIDVSVIGEGSSSEVAITPSRVAREAVLKDAVCVIIAHNHLSDSPILSNSDRRITNILEATLSAIGVPLIEHIIVTPSGYAPSMHMRAGSHGESLGTQALGEDFFTNFYNEK